MVLTILEARVKPQNWEVLETVYLEESKKLEPGIVRTSLVQSKSDETLWRIMTVWESQEALLAMRQSAETPTGILIFMAANAEPELSIFEVVADVNRQSA